MNNNNMREVGAPFRTRSALLLIPMLSLLLLFCISFQTNYKNYSSKIGIKIKTLSESLTFTSSSAPMMNQYLSMHDMMQMQNCSDFTYTKNSIDIDEAQNGDPDRGTIRCPVLVKTKKTKAGSTYTYRTMISPFPKTSLSSYHTNMMTMYNGTVNRDLFLHCMNRVTFPLDKNAPKECWPRPVILTSYPTSGNKLIRALLKNITSPMQTEMRQYYDQKDASAMFYKLLDEENENNITLDIYGTWNVPIASRTTRTAATTIVDTPAIPLMDRVVVFKSHMGSGGKETHEKHAHTLGQIIQNDRLYGILRIARNPGDHILRNKFRWKDNKCYRKEECFFQKAKVLCSSLVEVAQSYVEYHSFWDEYYLGNATNTTAGMGGVIPQKIVYYEHFTSKRHVRESVEGVLQYLDDLTPPEMTFKYGSLLTEEKVEEMKDVIIDPPYEHGTVVKRVCGDEIAKKVHAATKVVSERLGYVFDEKSATWSIDPPNSNMREQGITPGI